MIETSDAAAAPRKVHGPAAGPISKVELIAASLASLALTVVMTWPMAIKVNRAVPTELNDTLQMAWEVAWTGHALLHQPGSFYQANHFYPSRNTFAFTDAVVGYAPFGAIGRGPDAALIRYNLLNLLTYALAFFGAYLLARELGVHWRSAAIGAAAFGFAPWRLAHANHLNILSTGGVLLSIFFLVRGYRRRQPWQVLVGWLVATWQLSLGFAIGLPFAYLLAVVGVLAALTWLMKGRPPIARSLLISTAVGTVLFASAGAVLARPYFLVAKEHAAEIERRLEDVDRYSPPARGYLAAPAESIVWGGPTRSIRESLFWPPEQTLFPGLTVVVLAIIGSFAPSYPRRLRLGLVVAAVVAGVFALGTTFADGTFTYRLLQRLPGWGAVRTPGRIFLITSIALALLAPAGAGALLSWVKEQGRGRRMGRAIAPVTFLVLFGLVLLESAGRPPLRDVPKMPAGQHNLPSPQLHLPIGVPDVLYMYWSTDGFPKIPNGWGTFYPAGVREFQRQMLDFPSPNSVRKLNEMGIRVVVFHPDLARGTPWQSLPSRSLDGLIVTRRVTEGAVLYFLSR